GEGARQVAREVTLAAVQVPLVRGGSVEEARRGHLDAVAGLLAEAGRRGAHLAVLPELLNLMGAALPPDGYAAAAETLDGETVTTVRRLAAGQGVAVVLPIYRLDERQRLRNSAVVIDRAGEIAGCYDKVHPTRGEMGHGVVAGDTWPVFELDFGRVGVMICHDNSFVESARCLALGGAEIIAWPHVQSGWGDVVWDITLRSRAIDNGVYLVSSCYAVRGDGAWRPGMMVGRSGIVGQDGFILAEMSREAGVATATVDLDRQRLVHSWSTAGRRPTAG
ncbi:MAG TPA: carbon-nitrogen hydrolase family protein, partial [Chloroflexota bacterium]|nr:carbon-nitrogen hydrolase family protein [Chloroflexota bacterium]